MSILLLYPSVALPEMGMRWSEKKQNKRWWQDIGIYKNKFQWILLNWIKKRIYSAYLYIHDYYSLYVYTISEVTITLESCWRYCDSILIPNLSMGDKWEWSFLLTYTFVLCRFIHGRLIINCLHLILNKWYIPGKYIGFSKC